MVKVGLVDEEVVHDEGENGGVDVVAEEHGGGSFKFQKTHIGTKVKHDGVGIRDRIGEDQGQFLRHRNKGRLSRVPTLFFPFYPHFPRCGRDHKPNGLSALFVW